MDTTFGTLNGGILFDAVALAAIATFLLSLIKPFVELLPFARTTSPTHDATLRLLNVLLNIALALLAALAAGQLTATTWLPLILQGLAQAAGAQTLYHTTTRSGGSILAATGKTGNTSGNTSGNEVGNEIGNDSGNDDATSATPSLSAAQV
ncbi:MAG: hypothetical protein ACXVCO_17230, partial [Ktedonobacterales bacterium]